MPFRLFCTIFLLVSACAFPLYFTLAIGIFSVVWFPRYYEIVPIYFLHDLLYGVPLQRFFFVPYVMTLIALLAVFLSVSLRKHLFSQV